MAQNPQEAAIINKFKQMRAEVQSLGQKIGELEVELNEHK
jgi:hypothetical protein